MHLLLRGDARRIPLPDRSVDLVFGSPPYVDARLYLEDGVDLGISRRCVEWVDWMLGVTDEAMRVSRGLVLWACAGVTRDRNYQPACEGLLWEWWRRGGDCHCYRPAYWHRVGIPGSGGDEWLRSDVEYVLAFKRPGPLPWSDNTAMGHPPKWAPGGEMSHRMSSGKRVNAFGVRRDGVRIGAVRVNGRRAREETPDHAVCAADAPSGESYGPPVLANPGSLIRTNAGGNHLGPKCVHDNEAPFPEALAEFFVRSWCPPDGKVLDPFSGSGTTASVATRNGRHGIGIDLRQSQCRLGSRRIAEQLADVERPHRPKPRRGETTELPLFGASA